MDELSIFSERLKEIRTEMDISQRKMAELVGCTPATLSAYEKGTKKPSLEIAKNIADKCKVSLDYLCGLSESKHIAGKPKTYADAFRVLVEADKAIMFKIFREEYYLVLCSTNTVVQDFLEAWGDMLTMYHKGTITEKLYSLWVQDKLKEYEDFKLHDEFDVQKFLDFKEMRDRY